MLDSTLSQADGLLALSTSRAARLLAMVSHGDEQAELPLLWRLCSVLTDFGYPVTVLDATVCEDASNPGLEQSLSNACWVATDKVDAPHWSVLPAGIGVQQLCLGPADRLDKLRRLGHLFPADGVVILYCNAEWMVSLLADTDTEPLLVVSATKTSVMSSYLALKRLLKRGNIEPTIVNLVSEWGAGALSLGECARNFLGYDVKPIKIVARSDDTPAGDDLQRLALRLLESAVPLSSRASLSLGLGSRPALLREARSH
ncbi:MAG: hypothetical protein K9K38_03140 [Rhodoferax sp.]|nr:hypothetical protein [Rhodoferax sp.]